MKISTILAAGIGGALGSLLRYFLNISTDLTHFPFATMSENLIGSFFLGFITGYLLMMYVKEWIKVGLGVGVCGGFTTMSTFAVETLSLFHHSIISFFLYITISIIGGISLAYLGYYLGEYIGKRSTRKKVVDL